jgi:hypothetical protein
MLLVADGANEAPETLRLSTATTQPSDISPPTAETALFAISPDPFFTWERHSLRLGWEDCSIELAMGLRTGGEVHWWEACRLVEVEYTSTCRVIEMGGAIPLLLTSSQDLRDNPGYKFPLLHKHNWLNGQIHARLHSNGVCEIFAHHINSKFFDDGLDLEDAVPVIGIRTIKNSVSQITDLCGDWDGSVHEFSCGGVHFDVRDVAPLATPEKPGSMRIEDDFLVWQPYLGMELYGGTCLSNTTGDPYVYRAEQSVIPRGMSRTLRFSLSLNPERSATITRYQAPAWWYGHCEEFQPKPWLPATTKFDESSKSVMEYVRKYNQKGGFEDGSIPRMNSSDPSAEQHEPGWEGEVPYAQFLRAWRSGDAEDYTDAMRSAWYFTDVCVDHAAKQVRMHGFPPPAFSVPMARVLACVAAHLETGDPFPLNTARAVIDTAFFTHRNSWPRLAVGRDACFIRGAVMLYRYFGLESYRTIARESIGDVLNSQFDDGSFGDQGGGAGIHMWGGYIVKPWMGLMAVGGLIDYLEIFPEEEEIAKGVKRFADWLMKERHDHDGVIGWSYQHYYNGTQEFFDFYANKKVELPSKPLWHVEYLARLMMFVTMRYSDPAYFNAWYVSHKASEKQPVWCGDHQTAQVLQYIPWLEDNICQARLCNGNVKTSPVSLGDNATPLKVSIGTPNGKLQI